MRMGFAILIREVRDPSEPWPPDGIKVPMAGICYGFMIWGGILFL